MEESQTTPESTGTQDEPRRLLLIADEAFDTAEFKEQLGAHLGEETFQLFIVAPALTKTAIEHELNSPDDAIVEAQARLDKIIAGLSEEGIDAVGQVGDSEPIIALGDGMREFGADEILVVGHDEAHARYAEKGFLDRIKRDFTEPVVSFTVAATDASAADAEAPHLLDVQERAGGPRSEEDEIAASGNMPPLRRRDIVGMVVGIVGTIVLAILAADAAAGDEGNVEGRAAAMILIAIGAALINIGHVVGLLFFQSVRYEGIWEKFMARMSVGATTLGLVVSLFLWLT